MSDAKMICDVEILQPHSLLPKPEAPPGLLDSPSVKNDIVLDHLPLENFSVDIPAIGKFIRERSNSFSAAIAKKLSSFKENLDEPKSPAMSEFNISGLRVVVKLKNDDNKKDKEVIKGRISFFSRSNCRDCTAVRQFFREKGLKFVEINIDVYPRREKELVERTGSSSVPQIFFNEKLFGGLVALNSLRNSGDFDRRLREMVASKCPDDAPSPPVYGFDDDPEEEEESTEEIVWIVRVLRQRLPIQDRLMKMKIVKNCFAGCEMVEALIHHLDCGRKKAVQIGKQLAKKHFIHHVFGENDFEDGNHFYRFLEHEPFFPNASTSGDRQMMISPSLQPKRSVDYIGISNSEEFRRYVNLTQGLHRINLVDLTTEQRLAFFLNLYNAMVIHAVIRSGSPEGIMDRKFFSEFQYIVGGHPYSLSTIKNGIIRNNRRPPYSLVKPFGSGDNRLELVLPKVNPLIHFGLCDGTKSSPTVKFFSPQGIETELRTAAREFFQGIGMEVDLDKRTVHLTRIIKWFSSDFGQEKEILKWLMSYLNATKAGLLSHLLSDGGPVSISYKDYD
ncbi:hypothetical protein G4B88_011792 [Cannabis sativa]|uniref:DEP domain-containing protein n=1 Tax=Cannabis sativa TaxID=3483 RepID=A0A7J6FE54_CANSA|nr:hypothetical protein G4B88_011792 [Cannabis sativa]